ncbi:MAG: hypothetical protein ABJA98_03910 [Acidobacteriota bacterium]
MPSLESSIDSLYQGPPDQFVATRLALAKTLTRDEARLVKQLPKPTVAAWAANQVYWRTRPVYDRAIKSGKKVRSAQIAALNGRALDLREVVDEHRAAVAAAVAEASRLAAGMDAHPNTDELSRTFEALSLEAARTEPAGRLSKALQPAGFEALAGIVVKAPASARPSPADSSEKPDKGGGSALSRAAALAEVRRQKQAAERERAAAIATANAEVERARLAEDGARAELDRARAELDRLTRERESAEAMLARLQGG